MGNLEEALENLDFEPSPFVHDEDDWLATRELKGGPYDGEEFTWDATCGITLGTPCANDETHIALVSYDENGELRTPVGCRACARKEDDDG